MVIVIALFTMFTILFTILAGSLFIQVQEKSDLVEIIKTLSNALLYSFTAIMIHISASRMGLEYLP